MNFASVSKKNWIFKKYNNNKVVEISEKFSLKEITSRLLAIRNIEINDVNAFLNPTIKNIMPSPYEISGMEKAVDRISKSIKNKELIGIFGDYDVDGAASTALLSNYFSSIKHSIKTYIPDRQKDGYGPTIESFKKLLKEGSKTIITVDCGTSSFEAIKFAQESNVDVIVLDHHQSDINIPKAHSIVNPNKIGDSSNLNYLCAVGVCFMFLAALNKKLREIEWFKVNNISEPNILKYLDLVCIGTICDVVPLTGLNRAIVSQGLKIIKNRSNLGLKTLYDLCNIESQPNTYHIGYLIGPRINAGGRVGKSSYGAELLSSDNSETAYKLATYLNNYNKERQEIEKKLLKIVDEEAINNKSDPVLILHGENWHEGIIGIIAARIKDKYNKPTLVISFKGNKGKGSARSVYGFDIGTAIISAVQSGILVKGGGHKMAGGFSIRKENIEKFKSFITNKFKKINLDNLDLNNLYLDGILSVSALNEEFFNEINLLSPFGPGNKEPTFVLENMKIVKSIIVGDKHIKAIMTARNGKSIEAIAFNSKDGILESYLSRSYKKEFHIAGKIYLNEWRGKRKIEFMINDIAT